MDNKENKTLNVPTLRFAKYTDEWHKFALSDFVTRITRRNKNNESSLPLTISSQYGLVDQITFFNKTVASVDLSGYYLLYNGDFAYNKSYSNDYAWGAVKRLDKYEKGCLSSLYFVFRPTDKVDSDYLTHYFETSKWHKGISDIAGEGARNHGLLNMAVDDYFATKHYLPSLSEQKKIACFLNLITKRIEIQNKIIEDLYTQIKSISYAMVNSIREYVTIKELCSFEQKTNHQSGDGLSEGLYPFFTNEETTKKYFNVYDYDGEYIIANTGGKANFKYFNGKFATMSDCLVIKFNNQSLTIFYSIVFSHLQKYIDYVGFEGSSLKHLNKDWLLKLKVPQYEKQTEKFICLIDNLKKKLQKENTILSLYKKQKVYFLQNMFI